jgi:hypothetical protein
MVVFRGALAANRSSARLLAAQTRENRTLGDLLAWLPDNIRRDLTVDSSHGVRP